MYCLIIYYYFVFILLLQVIIWKIIYMNWGERCEAMINHGTCVQVLINCEIIKSPHKFRLQRDSNPLTLRYRCRGPFLERPGNLTGPESDFDIKVSRKVGRVLTSDEVHFVSLADNFTAQFQTFLNSL